MCLTLWALEALVEMDSGCKILITRFSLQDFGYETLWPLVDWVSESWQFNRLNLTDSIRLTRLNRVAHESPVTNNSASCRQVDDQAWTKRIKWISLSFASLFPMGLQFQAGSILNGWFASASLNRLVRLKSSKLEPQIWQFNQPILGVCSGDLNWIGWLQWSGLLSSTL